MCLISYIFPGYVFYKIKNGAHSKGLRPPRSFAKRFSRYGRYKTVLDLMPMPMASNYQINALEL